MVKSGFLLQEKEWVNDPVRQHKADTNHELSDLGHLGDHLIT